MWKKETLEYSQGTDVGVWRTQLAALLSSEIRKKDAMNWKSSKYLKKKNHRSIYWLTKLLIIISYVKYRISFRRNLRKKGKEGEKEGERKDNWIFGSILLAQGNVFC